MVGRRVGREVRVGEKAKASGIGPGSSRGGEGLVETPVGDSSRQMRGVKQGGCAVPVDGDYYKFSPSNGISGSS